MIECSADDRSRKWLSNKMRRQKLVRHIKP